MSNPEVHLERLLRDATLHREAHFEIVNHLKDVLNDVDRQVSFLAALYQDTGLPLEVRVRMLIHAADLGHRPAFDLLLSEFGDLSAQHAARALYPLSHFPDRSVGDRIIVALRARDSTPQEKVRFASSFLFGAMNRLEEPTYAGGAILPAPPHPSFSDFLALLEEWWTTTKFALADELAMTEMAARNRLSGGVERLRELATRIIHTQDTKGYANPFNQEIRSAMDELARQRLCLDLSTAIHLAENTDSNAEIGALSHIGAIGTREALDYLLERSRRDGDNYSTIFQGVESISSRLGLKVLETSDGLELVKTAG